MGAAIAITTNICHTVTTQMQNHFLLVAIQPWPDRQPVRCHEANLIKSPVLRDKIEILKYGAPDDTVCELVFTKLPTIGIHDAVRWLYGHGFALAFSSVGRIEVQRVVDVWNVAHSWKLAPLRLKILDCIKEEIGNKRRVVIHELTTILTEFYCTNGLSSKEQNDISDTINTAIQHFSPHSWWANIQHDTRKYGAGTMYQRIAGLLFRNLRNVCCERCSIDKIPTTGNCIVCGEALPFSRPI
ncbi:hypothetical protein DRE_04141 [Drechslerella stenobrocha 248]|uniref:BTB domain-containing protein n=1 Tax=Drechslerella stenobrocha 248 TaxID=1043628 RepID=W7HTF9_9PEZI|nr:hypothetical protein DRE_04141 [Drechslerella stenobrocha 248]